MTTNIEKLIAALEAARTKRNQAEKEIYELKDLLATEISGFVPGDKVLFKRRSDGNWEKGVVGDNVGKGVMDITEEPSILCIPVHPIKKCGFPAAMPLNIYNVETSVKPDPLYAKKGEA